MSKKIIGIFVGSLRKESYSKKIANFICTAMPENIEMRMIDIGNLAIYNQDFDDEGISPKEWETFRKECKELDGFLFITPEYNRSLPAVLKNALDVGSRPYGQNVWDGKPGAVISTSIGKISGFGANHHLRQSAVFLNILMLQQPEAYIGDVASLLDEKGDLVDEGTQTFLQSFGSAFAQWIATCSKK